MRDELDLAGLSRAEDRLQAAVRAGDAAALAAVLHDNLVATGPDGRLVDKQEDLAQYLSGEFRVDAYIELSRDLLLVGTTGVTFVLAHVSGQSGVAAFDVHMRYTRTWIFDEVWQVLAAHLSEVEP